MRMIVAQSMREAVVEAVQVGCIFSESTTVALYIH